ncbi:MAG: ankyrin repeat domain-containing protein [Alphaproteobacteria bacterium]
MTSKAKVTRDAVYDLYNAAERNSVADLKLWAETYGAENIDICRDKYSRTALLEACVAGRTAAARVLLDAGANPDHAASNGLTPLHAAVLGEKLDLLAALLDAGADIEKKWTDNTPLQQAAAYGHAGVMRLLIDRGADPTCLTTKGETLAETVFNDKDGSMAAIANGAASRVFGEKTAKACTEGAEAPVQVVKKISLRRPPST